MTRLDAIRTPEKDYGLGRCACGYFAIAGLNGRGHCLTCLETALQKIGTQLARLEEPE